jgi:cytochrome c-type biogenesis protein CcmE
MALLPKSRTARRRLMIVGAITPILALSVGLTLYAMRDAVVFFYAPAEAHAAHVPSWRTVRIGGLVQPGSLTRQSDGDVRFDITDNAAVVRTVYRGELPDLFREGQGVVAEGAFEPDGGFRAKTVLAKHDENYMPKEVVESLKARGEWQRDGAPQ